MTNSYELLGNRWKRFFGNNVVLASSEIARYMNEHEIVDIAEMFRVFSHRNGTKQKPHCSANCDSEKLKAGLFRPNRKGRRTI